MVHQKPRFGGAQNMEHRLPRENSKIVKANMAGERKMDNVTCSEEEKEINREHFFESDGDLKEVSFAKGGFKRKDGELSSHHTTPNVDDNDTGEQTHSNRKFIGVGNDTGSDSKSNQGNETQVVYDCGNLDTLMSCFQSLGIQATPRPYSRKEDQRDQIFEGVMYSKSDNCTELSVQDTYDVVYCKNLFLKDRKSQFYLVVVNENKAVDLKQLKQELSAHRNLSFADKESMKEILQVEAGYVSPFSVMLSSAKNIRFAIDKELTECKEKLVFHPFDPTLQVELSFPDLDTFVQSFQFTLEVLGTNDLENKPKKADTDGKPKKKEKTKTPKRPNCFKKEDRKENSTETTQEKSYSKREELSKHNMKQKGTHIGEGLMESAGGNIVDFTYTNKESHIMNSYSDNLNSDKIDSTHQSLKSVRVHGSEEKKEMTNEILFTTKTSSATSIIKSYGRKGKLRSFLKKKGGKNEINNDDNSEHAANSQDESLDLVESVSHFSTTKTFDTKTSCKNLPEVDHFYEQLDKLNISYKEFDVVTSDSKDIGPSIGCKTILLKDKRQNYFVIVTHEFYELDFGRLKKALKPKKKLELADNVDIMLALGVDPHRLTPFGIKKDHKDMNVRIFFTEKISPSPIKLCIMHPFAKGYRLVITSSELKRFLTADGAVVDLVEEKAWLSRYSFMFTQFEKYPQEKKITPELCSKSAPFPRDSSSSVDREMEMNHLPFSGVPESDRSFLRNVTVFGFSFIGLHYPNRTPEFHVQDPSNHEGSPVDPPKSLSTTLKTKAVDLVPCWTAQELPVGAGWLSKKREKTVKERKIAWQVKSKEKSHVEGQSLMKNNRQNSSEDESECFARTDVGVDEIASHLCKYGVQFQVRRKAHISSAVSEPVGKDKMNDVKKSVQVSSKASVNKDLEKVHLQEDLNAKSCEDETEMHIDVMESGDDNRNDDFDNECNHHIAFDEENEDNDDDSDDEDIVFEKGDIESSESEEEEEVGNNDANEVIENCSTIHFHDKYGNLYIIVCGERDLISKRRFARRFQISTLLYVCNKMRAAGEGSVMIHPFSIAIPGLKQKSQHCYIVLATSIYMDNNTRLKFRIDTSGSSVSMSAEEFERYLKLAGFEVWYMP